MTDRELILKKLEQIEQALQVLERHRTHSAKEFERSLETRWIVERGLEIIMQAVFDIGAHILAADRKNDWEDYAGLIEKLGLHGVVPEEFARRFRDMAGFRNVLVHEYLEIDLRILERVVKEELENFRKFVRYIMEYLERKAGGGSLESEANMAKNESKPE